MDIALNLTNPTMVRSEESLLIAACIRSERWAQQKLYELHYGKLMTTSMRYSNNKEDALDILHEGFIKIFANLKKYQADTSLLAWMRRVVVNSAIDYYRKEIRHKADDIEKAYTLHTDEVDAVSRCTEQEILACIQQLPASYRTVFNLFAVEGFSHKEIADATGISESTARANLAKARQRLQQLLAQKFPHLNK
jgi:RNA polymerase sigma factor (sigma-70 family)